MSVFGFPEGHGPEDEPFLGDLGRADLIRVVMTQGEAAFAAAARCLGLSEVEALPVTTSGSSGSVEGQDEPERFVHAPRTRFLRVISAHFEEEAEVLAQREAREAAQRRVAPLSDDEIRGTGRAATTKAPSSTPWATWADYGLALHQTLAAQTGLGPLDVETVIQRMSRCETITPLPRKPTLAVERTIWVWLDRTLEDRIYWREQLALLDELIRVYGPALVRGVLLDEPPRPELLEHMGPLFRPGDLSLALSEQTAATAWSAFGWALLRWKQHPVAFSFSGQKPASPWRAPALPGARVSPGVDQALTWLAFTEVVDPGHLRAVCRRLNLGPETEQAVWTDPRLVLGASGRGWLAASVVQDLRARFRALGNERSEAIALQARWRGHHPVEVLAQEYLALRAEGQHALMPPAARGRAETFLERLAATGRGAQPHARSLVLSWVRRTEAQVGAHAFGGNDPVGLTLQPLWREAQRASPTSIPDSIDLRVAFQDTEATVPARHVLFVRGHEVGSVVADNESTPPYGARLGEVVARAPVARITHLRPPWATDAGVDAFGRWAAFEVAGVQQRMRWIEPGTFLMGSPDEQEGRYDDEGPQHAVTLSEGFWLAETPCTQALWHAVMGDNPSRFQGGARPVERVSHDDVFRLFARLEALQPGLDLTLPTEAQWEYACRAGTTGDRYGPLDEVAFYGDNSGDETHSVAQKAPNPWGLYDTLGNVYEWCLDGAAGEGAEYYGRAYEAAVVLDPVLSPSDERPLRVLRGGSWHRSARSVRAASRYAYPPDSRYPSVGFRFSRGRAAEPMAPAEPAGAERGTRGAEVGGGDTLDLKTGRRRLLPPSGPVQIETDRTTLVLEPFERPQWAHGVGQDRYGLFADVEIASPTEVTPVSFRMRWLPPGRFWMGSPEGEAGRYDREGPQHLVTLTEGFWLATTPCTQRLWTAVMGAEARPSEFQSPDRPVESVSVDDVAEFMARLNSEIPGLALRLPTEAEWEYACRAGTTEATYQGNLSRGSELEVLDAIAWYRENSHRGFELASRYDYGDGPAGTHPVGRKSPNPWGLFDMLGNVLEWCADGATSDSEQASEGWGRRYEETPVVDPFQAPSEERTKRVLRGGSWSNGARGVRAASRLANLPVSRLPDVGFRFSRGRAAEPMAPAEPASAGPAEAGSAVE